MGKKTKVITYYNHIVNCLNEVNIEKEGVVVCKDGLEDLTPSERDILKEPTKEGNLLSVINLTIMKDLIIPSRYRYDRHMYEDKKCHIFNHRMKKTTECIRIFNYDDNNRLVYSSVIYMNILNVREMIERLNNPTEGNTELIRDIQINKFEWLDDNSLKIYTSAVGKTEIDIVGLDLLKMSDIESVWKKFDRDARDAILDIDIGVRYDSNNKILLTTMISECPIDKNGNITKCINKCSFSYNEDNSLSHVSVKSDEYILVDVSMYHTLIRVKGITENLMCVLNVKRSVFGTPNTCSDIMMNLDSLYEPMIGNPITIMTDYMKAVYACKELNTGFEFILKLLRCEPRGNVKLLVLKLLDFITDEKILPIISYANLLRLREVLKADRYIKEVDFQARIKIYMNKSYKKNPEEVKEEINSRVELAKELLTDCVNLLMKYPTDEDVYKASSNCVKYLKQDAYQMEEILNLKANLSDISRKFKEGE